MSEKTEPLKRVGPARLPRHDLPVRNVVSFREALGELESSPEVLGLDNVDPAAIEIGLKIKRAREKIRLSQSGLAEISGVDQPTISQIENGKGTQGPTYKVLRDLAAGLGLVIDLVPPAGTAAGIATGINLLTGRAPEASSRSAMNFLSGAGIFECQRDLHELDAAEAIFSSLFTPAIRREAHKAMLELLGQRKAQPETGGLFCGYWSAAPKAQGSIAVRRDLMFLGFGEGGSIMRKTGSSVPSSDRIVIAPSRSRVVIENDADKPFGFLVLPVLPAVADALAGQEA